MDTACLEAPLGLVTANYIVVNQSGLRISDLAGAHARDSVIRLCLILASCPEPPYLRCCKNLSRAGTMCRFPFSLFRRCIS